MLMSNAYQDALLLNEKVIDLIDQYKEESDDSLLYEIHRLMIPVSRTTIHSLLRDSGFDDSMMDDMLQEAYLRIWSALWAFDGTRTPSFISFWRRVLRNHLQTIYQKEWRLRALPDELKFEVSEDRAEIAHRKLIIIKNKKLEEYRSWENKEQGKIARAILLTRIIQTTPREITQKILAERFKLSQTHLSNWERWVWEDLMDTAPEILRGYDDPQ